MSTGPLLLLINLDRSPDRLAAATAAFGALGLPLRRLPAVDAAVLAPEAIAESYDARGNARDYFSPLHPGEVACFLSHRRAWADLLASEAPFAAVFEDDAVPSARLPAVLDALATTPPGWDVVKLHGSSTEASTTLGPLGAGTALVRPWIVSLSGAAYCVSRAGAAKLLGGTAPFRRPLDVELQHWWEHGLDLLAVKPHVAAVARFPSGSTIRPHRARDGRERLRRELRRPVFRVRLALRSVWERLRGRPGR